LVTPGGSNVRQGTERRARTTTFHRVEAMPNGMIVLVKRELALLLRVQVDRHAGIRTSRGAAPQEGVLAIASGRNGASRTRPTASNRALSA
jgi:hypothetical protein